MALSYVGGTSGTGTSTGYTVSLSGTLTGGSGSSPAAGDIVVVFSGFGNTASSAPAVSGNNSGAYQAATAAQHVNDTWDTEFRSFYQVMGATPDTSLTITRVTNAAYGGGTTVHVWRGADTISPFIGAATPASGGNGAALNPPAYNPSVTGAIIIAGGAGTFAAADTAGYTGISGMSNTVTAYGNGSTADIGVIMASFAYAGSSYDPATATGGTQNNASSSWAGVTLALRPAPDPITGTLSATESGADTASITGDVFIDGALAATESGSDTAALTGTVADAGGPVSGALAATESGSDTASIAGAVLVEGALSASESGADTAAIAGDVLVQGSIAATETGSDTASLAGDVLVQGTLAATETGSDTAAFSSATTATGTLDATESGQDTASFTGTAAARGLSGRAVRPMRGRRWEPDEDREAAQQATESANEAPSIADASLIAFREAMARTSGGDALALARQYAQRLRQIVAQGAQHKRMHAKAQAARMQREQAEAELIRIEREIDELEDEQAAAHAAYLLLH
jgi:hypothetical protein